MPCVHIAHPRSVDDDVTMRSAKCHDTDYIDFLIASPTTFTCTEAANVQESPPQAPDHDSFTRLLTRIEPDPETPWTEARNLVALNAGALVIDDSTLDKPYAKDIALVTRHWSGKHHDELLSNFVDGDEEKGGVLW